MNRKGSSVPVMVGGILIGGIIMAASGGVNAGFAFGLLFAVLGAVGGLLVDGGMSGSVENAGKIQNYERESGGGPVEAEKDSDSDASNTAYVGEDVEGKIGRESRRNNDTKIVADGGMVQEDELLAELSEDTKEKLEEIEELAEKNELELERMREMFAELPDQDENSLDRFMRYLEEGEYRKAKKYLDSGLEKKAERQELQTLKKSTEELARMVELEDEVKEEMKNQIEILKDEKERLGDNQGKRKAELNEEISRLEKLVERFEMVEENQAKIEKMQERFLES